ncbi:MAG: hypothetical protein MUC50_19280 [Myxococcota bacterium]|nr:hypothetical protein [Myxococcota bacterium]
MARRLTPFELVKGTQTIPIVRYEGKLSCGAKVTALAKHRESGATELELWFPAAAAQWIHAQGEEEAWHLAVGPQAAIAAAWLLALGLENVGALLPAHQEMSWPAARDAMSKVRWIGVLTDDGLLPSDSAMNDSFQSRGLLGRLHALPMPGVTSGNGVISGTARVQAKATAQLQSGLPVSSTTPLVLLESASTEVALEALRSALRHGLQILCTEHRHTSALTELRETYPDRLACPSGQSRCQLLRQVDACVALDDTELAYDAALGGALPIVVGPCAGMLTELATDLSSGSAVIVTAMEDACFDEALARFASLYSQSRSLGGLTARLSECVPSWTKTAAYLLELMAEPSRLGS